MSPDVARVAGYHHLGLTVTDLARSVKWYCEVLGLETEREIEGRGFRRVRLRSPGGGLTLSLTAHQAGAGERFDERRAGLDHVAFRVGTVGEVEDLKQRFERLGVDHSEIKRSADKAMITLRDPDNIQLEVFAGG
ncbi:MAG TPA: VOC family protein [Acidimicrobiales bacterium]|nr:VOC family protein [Acidimicrobiales bacterium]